MKILNFCHISLQYADKCHFDGFIVASGEQRYVLHSLELICYNVQTILICSYVTDSDIICLPIHLQPQSVAMLTTEIKEFCQKWLNFYVSMMVLNFNVSTMFRIILESKNH
jgi:hypothetical protein